MRISIGYKFIFGFLAVIAVVGLVPEVMEKAGVIEWMRLPVSILTGMVIGLILGLIFTRGFTRDFTRLTQMAKRISLGDLSYNEDMNKKSKFFPDEVTDLDEALLLVFTNLKGLIGYLKKTVLKLVQSQASLNEIIGKGHETSTEVVDGSGKIFSGALQQAHHIEDSSKAIKEVLELADSVAGKVTETVNASQKVNSMIHRGANTATSAIEKVEGIFKGIEKTENAATRLKEKLNDIPKVLDVIIHISRQTDLLALNATIEASKAGEHGRGFAMVAEEVRRFADNTKSSTDEVGSIVRDLMAEVERVVATAEEGTESAKEGRDDIRKIREIFGEITDYTAEVVELANLIVSLTNKQKEKSENAVQTIEDVADIARKNLAHTEVVDRAIEKHGAAIEQTLLASQGLLSLSEELKGVAEKFKAE